LDKRGLKLGLYYTGDGPNHDPQANAGMACPKDGQYGQDIEFVKRWTSVLQEYSVRYGDKVVAWWVDGCYHSTGYNVSIPGPPTHCPPTNQCYHYSAYIAQDTTLKYYHDAIRLGNPNAFIGLNNGVHKIQGGVAWLNGGEKTQWEDMTAGETDSFNR
jgi:hypothetical protein